MTTKPIHQKIKNQRIKLDMTQDQVAEKLGISRSTYQYWERKTPSVEDIKKVAEVFGLSEDYFFSANDEIFSQRETVGKEANARDKWNMNALEQAMVNLSEARIIDAQSNLVNARNIENLLRLLESHGADPAVKLPDGKGYAVRDLKEKPVQ